MVLVNYQAVILKCFEIIVRKSLGITLSQTIPAAKANNGIVMISISCGEVSTHRDIVDVVPAIARSINP